MSKKVIIIIVVAFIAVLGIFGIVKINKNKANKNNNEKLEKTVVQTDVKIDENTGEYIIYDKETGEERARVLDEMSVQIYLDNPDYDPQLPSGFFDERNFGTIGE